jgi:membrane fusion protein, multidrug efflux system
MKPKQILIGGIVVLCAGLGVFALVKMHGSAGGGDSGDENVPSVIPVQVGALKRMTLHQYLNAYGMIEAAPATADEPAAGGILAAPQAGVVAKVNVVAGQAVSQGDVLVELDSASATYNYAKQEVGRQRQLFKQQNTSLKNVQDAEAQLSSLQIVAPVSGTVTELNVKPGQAVDVNTPVAEVIDLGRLAVGAKIPSAQAGALQTGQQVRLSTENPITTSLAFVSPRVSPDDGTVAVWASLPTGTELKPGDFVQFRIVTAVHTNCLAAPAESVVTDDDGNSTIALVSGNEATQTNVTAGFREDNWVEISAPGLKEGDPVVTMGAYGLPDTTQIKIVNSSDDSATNSPDAQ